MNKLFTRILSFIVVLVLTINTIQAQITLCPVRAKANVTNIFCGDTVKLVALASGAFVIRNDFNQANERPGTEWAQDPSAQYDNPCGGPVGGAGGAPTYIWFGQNADVPRLLASKPFDLSTGGYISFYMKYAVQGGSGSCEGIDLPEEGVYLQYNVAGAGWQTIEYFDPLGGTNPMRTSWTNYVYTIPPAACMPNTQIRWIQIASSGQPNDHWGLDSIEVVRNDPNFLFDWLHDPAAPNITGATPPVTPYSDTTYTVVLFNKNNPLDRCIDSVKITTVLPSGIATANPTQLCAGQTSVLNVNPSFIPPPPSSCGISPTGCLGVTQTIDIGTGTVNSTNYTPFGRAATGGCTSFTLNGNCVGNCDNSGRTQFIVSAAELTPYFKGGQIYNLGLNIASGGGTYSLSISLKCSGKTEFATNTDFETGMVEVFAPKDVPLVAGWNNIDFDFPYDWDGVSNVVIQFCWTSGGFQQGNVFKTTTANYSAINAYSCGALGCAETGNATRYQSRPTVRLGICYRPIPALTYNWQPAGHFVNNTLKSPTATVPATTEYTVTVSDVKRPQCNLVRKVTVGTTSPIVSLDKTEAYICAAGGSTTITASATPSTGTGTITGYSWSPALGLSATNTATVTASPTVTTVYTCTVTDNTGCSDQATVTVYVNPATTFNLGSNTPCVGQDINLTCDVAGATYAWTGPGGFTSNVQNPSRSNATAAMAGSYGLSITVGGCTGTPKSINVTVNPKDDATFDYGNTTFCPGAANPTPTKSVAGTFSASPAGLVFVSTSTGEVNIAASALGNYVITFTSSGICQDIKTQAFNIVSTINSTFAIASVCKSATSLAPDFSGAGSGSPGTFTCVSANAADLKFKTSGAPGEIDLPTSLPGTYTIRNSITTSCGNSTHEETFTISPAPDPSYTGVANNQHFCLSSPAVTLTPTQAGGTFSGNGISGSSFTPANAGVGTHTIKYKIVNGGTMCADSLSKVVVVDPSPVAGMTGDFDICAGEVTQLQASGGGTYKWSTGQTNNRINVSPTTTTNYKVVVTNSGCKDSITRTVVVNSASNAPISVDDNSICLGNSANLSVNVGDDWEWYDITGGGKVLLATSVNQIAVQPNTDRDYQVRIISAAGCSSSPTTKIFVNIPPTVLLSPFLDTCQNVTAFNLSGGSPLGGTYTGPGVSANRFNPANAGVGTHTITYNYTDANGCSGSDNANITVKAVPATPDPGSDPICEGDPLVFFLANVDPAGVYTWTGPNGYTSDEAEPTIGTATLANRGIYRVNVTVANCQSTNGQETVTINALPQVSITPSAANVCDNTPVTLSVASTNGVAINKYTWTASTSEVIANNTQQTISVLPHSYTFYSVAVSSTSNCPGSASVGIGVTAYPAPYAGPDTIACAGIPFSLNGRGAANTTVISTWSPATIFATPSDPRPTITLPDTGQYIVYFKLNQGGCEREDTAVVHVLDCSVNPVLYPPDIFTPNGNGTNETWKPTTDKLMQYHLTIFSRWGDKVFETKDPNEGWDGTIRGGALATNGVYIYIIDAVDLNGKYIKTKYGAVTLTR